MMTNSAFRPSGSSRDEGRQIRVVRSYPRDDGPAHAGGCAAAVAAIAAALRQGGGAEGWHFVEAPELRFPAPVDGPRELEGVDEVELVTPFAAAWRRERAPELAEAGPYAVAPDWVFDADGPGFEAKMRVYERVRVRHAWALDAVASTLAVYALERLRSWGAPTVYRDPARLRAAPFAPLEIDLASVWLA